MSKLIAFLKHTMSMTEVYQPVIIKELLCNKGTCSKDQLAFALAKYDVSIRDYYRKIVMRWPKKTLMNHDILQYDRKEKTFRLTEHIVAPNDIRAAIDLCDQAINTWIAAKQNAEKSPEVNESIRYRILKQAKGRCQLCGIPSSLRPIDIDHIIPQSQADKRNTVLKDGTRIPVHSEENLQALCFKCNRAKRDADDTDFRRRRKLVRDRIPEIIKDEGRNPQIKILKGKALIEALHDKLLEEFEEYFESHNVEELADIQEVILALVESKGMAKKDFMKLVKEKRDNRGGFKNGYFYESG